MSRTRKDIPLWVKSNREGVIDHDHRLIGYPRYERRIMRDAKGEPVTKTVTKVRVTEYVVTNVYPFIHTKSLLEALSRAGYSYGHIRSTYENYEAEEVQYETVQIGEYEDCGGHVENNNANEKYGRWGRSPVQCSIEVPFSYRSRPRKQEKRNFHHGSRRQERDNLKEYAKAYNGGADMMEEDFNDVLTRPRFHEGWW